MVMTVVMKVVVMIMVVMTTNLVKYFLPYIRR